MAKKRREEKRREGANHDISQVAVAGKIALQCLQ